MLVPDQLGHGERRQHDFNTEKDYDKPFRVSRQDYYFRYNSNLQLSAAGESLMGWMVWDLMRGVDVLSKQKNIDKDRIIMLGSVAGGGDPAGVTAALDPRIACVVPFNFGGWQPESSVLENPDRDFAVVRRRLLGEHARAEERRPRRLRALRDRRQCRAAKGDLRARVRLGREDRPGVAAVAEDLRLLRREGQNRLGVTARGAFAGRAGRTTRTATTSARSTARCIYPALKEWFGMPIPEEYSKNRPGSDLRCWTDEAVKELKPKKLHEVVGELADERAEAWTKRSTG